MTISIGFWSQELIPGKEEVVVPITDLRITNVALGDELADASGRTTVKITYYPAGNVQDEDEDEDEDDEKLSETTTVLCSLTAGKFEHTTTDIVLERDEEYTFKVVGKNTIYLSGNYIDQTAVDNPPFVDSDMDSEDEYSLEGASDVDMQSDEIETDASRFEEVPEEVPEDMSKKPKRARESDTAGAGVKAEKKNKKLKAEGGQAVVAGTGKEEVQGEKKEAKQEKKEKKKEKSGEEKKAKPTEKELPGGIKILDSAVGSGPAAKKGNTVQMRYIGKLQNGKVFDKNVKGKPFTFRLGQGQVIKGWDEGIVGMHVGGERKLTIPPSMGYGKKGTEGIPPNSTLIFEVKLLEIK
ncbi:hypothetical protein AX17_004509 [Amanita inopinata Kibby_2008]|nr:hypothetical protein AX17_004509 [Amanita inopinata Kibby_2008]